VQVGNWLLDRGTAVSDRLFDLHRATAWPWLFASLVIAAVVVAIRNRRRDGDSDRESIFSRAVWNHASARVDYRYALVDVALRGAVYVPVIVASGRWAYKLGSTIRGPHWVVERLGGAGLEHRIVQGVLIFVVADLGVYVGHYLGHRVPILWHFHEVHHTAEVMTPVTALRIHPMDDFLGTVFISCLTGATAGLLGFDGKLADTGVPLFLGVNMLTVAFYLTAFHLRHSHVWLSYGRLGNRIFISPAQHQIHHSRSAAHYDRNFGFTFAVWDLMFGTLYVPQGREQIAFGVEGTDPEDFATVWRLYTRPFWKAGRQLRLAYSQRRAHANPAAGAPAVD
jgi:sterol desaturase/sphingolipid hydroxylase (fatty acid hydroxylase superfamily)